MSRSPAPPRLIVLAGPLPAQEQEIVRSTWLIGRDPSCDLQLLHDTVSRRHASITWDDAGWLITDLGSSNGVRVEGRATRSERLTSGARIALGDIALTFLAPTAAGPTAADETDSLAAAAEQMTLRIQQVERLIPDPSHAQLDARLRALVQLASDAAASTTIDALAGIVVARMQEALGPARAFLITQEGSGRLALHDGSTPGRSETEFTPLGISLRVLRSAQHSGDSILAIPQDPSDPFRSSSTLHQLDIGSLACAPLRWRGQTLGYLYLDRDKRAGRFERADLEYLVALASQVVVALDAVHRTGELEQTRALRERELAISADIVGTSPPMLAVYDFIARAAPADAPVLILGESGTGKELVARAIYRGSRRRSRPFEIVNSAALSDTLLESELFGHVRGAFTGAVQDRKGRLALADGGMIFLDEIGEMSPGNQAKLLRALEHKEIRPLGASHDLRVDVRVIAATHRDLGQLVREGRFRQDLYFRLNVLTIELPPLRARRDDLDAIVQHFLRQLTQQLGRPAPSLDTDVRALFARYDWPGNVRELKNALERMVILSQRTQLTIDDVPAEIRGQVDRVNDNAGFQPELLADVERRHLLATLAHVKGNKQLAAKLLGIDRGTLYAKLRAWGL